MPEPNFFVKQGDTLPAISRTLEDADGNAVDLTGGSVLFKMRPLNGTAIFGGSAVVTGATAGTVRYDWQTADTETAGLYLGEWELTLDGDIETFPNYGYDLILVTDDA